MTGNGFYQYDPVSGRKIKNDIWEFVMLIMGYSKLSEIISVYICRLVGCITNVNQD
jgi:hypothetical protein